MSTLRCVWPSAATTADQYLLWPYKISNSVRFTAQPTLLVSVDATNVHLPTLGSLGQVRAH